jgi:hypothetical protein
MRGSAHCPSSRLHRMLGRGQFGNRFDDPGGDYRVLYASSLRVGAFVEVLARYRSDPALVAEYAEIIGDDGDDHPTIPPGIVPGDWPAGRHVGTATYLGPFANVGHSDSLAHLRAALRLGCSITGSTISTAATCADALREYSPRRSPATCASAASTRAREARSPTRGLRHLASESAFRRRFRLSGDSSTRFWLARAKFVGISSVYGTEGHRFESCRARSLAEPNPTEGS